MKTIKQIKQLVENIAASVNGTNNNELIDSVRNNFLPLFQFNMDASSSENAQILFNKIAENVNRSSSVKYLPDGHYTKDVVGNIIIETPTIMEWQGGKAGQNFVINYTNKSAEKAIARLSQLIVDMLLSLPGRCFNLHFVDLAFSAQASFLTRNLDEKLYGKLLSSPNEWQQLRETLSSWLYRAHLEQRYEGLHQEDRLRERCRIYAYVCRWWHICLWR